MKKQIAAVILLLALVLLPTAAGAQSSVGDWGWFGTEKIERGYSGAVPAGESADVSITLGADGRAAVADHTAEVVWHVTHWNGTEDVPLKSGENGVSWTLSPDSLTLTLSVDADGASLGDLTLGAALNYKDGRAPWITPGGLLVRLNAKNVASWDELTAYVASCTYHENRPNRAVLTAPVTTPENTTLRTALDTFLQGVTLVVEEGASLTITKDNAVWTGVEVLPGGAVTVRSGGVLSTPQGADIVLAAGYPAQGIPAGSLTVDGSDDGGVPGLLVTAMGSFLRNRGTFTLNGDYYVENYGVWDADRASDGYSYRGDGGTVSGGGKLYCDRGQETPPAVGNLTALRGGLPVYTKAGLDYWLENARQDHLCWMGNRNLWNQTGAAPVGKVVIAASDGAVLGGGLLRIDGDTYTAEASEGSKLFLVQYDSRGKLTGLTALSLPAAGSLSGGVPRQGNWKLILLDGTTLAPLCEGVTSADT